MNLRLAVLVLLCLPMVTDGEPAEESIEIALPSDP